MVMEKTVARLVLEAVIETVVQVVGPRQVEQSSEIDNLATI